MAGTIDMPLMLARLSRFIWQGASLSSSQQPEVPDVIRQIVDSGDRRLAWEFFIFFSRFEYALKRDARYLKPGKGRAEPFWDQFGRDNDASFERATDAIVLAAVQYITEHAPRKQLRDNGVMLWSEPLEFSGDQQRLVWLLSVIRIVRNNLFHGGKFPLIPISDPSRERELITSALTILNVCLHLDLQVRQHFLADIADEAGPGSRHSEC